MNSSPLSLERVVFTAVHLDAVTEGVPAPRVQEDASQVWSLAFEVRCEIDFERHTEEDNRFRLGLKVNLDSPAGRPAPYVGRIEVEGYFGMARNSPREQWETTVAVQGAGVLFGAIREMVSFLTARGPWGPLTLPMVNFGDLTEQFQASAFDSLPEHADSGAFGELSR